MVTRIGAVAAALFGAALAGCSTGRRVDALKALGVDEKAATRELSVVVVYSEATNKTITLLHHWQLTEGDDSRSKIFKELPGLIGAHFKSSSVAETFDAALALKPDLVALVDTYANSVGYGVGRFKMDMKVVFVAPDRKEIESISSEHAKAVGPLGLTPAGHWVWGSAIHDVGQALEEDLDKGISASSKLSQFAALRAIAAAAPAAAPVRTWHSDVDAPDYRRDQDPNFVALVVGIEKYSAMPDAQFAERDAAAVKEHLIALGVPPRNIRFLAGAQATRASLTKDLDSWLPSVVTENSTVFFYYSGHGAPELKTGQAYLVPWDGDAQFLPDTALPVSLLYQRLNALKAKRVIVALDSCFSGRGARSLLAKGARPLVTKLDTASSAVGSLTVLTASADEEIAGSDDAQGHGIFTYYLLKGLSGAAADEKGHVTVRSLHSYLVPKVRDAASRENRDQVPQLLPSAAAPAADFVLK